jgi:hypothetical protein
MESADSPSKPVPISADPDGEEMTPVVCSHGAPVLLSWSIKINQEREDRHDG